ncbi:hypothetical protein F4810DRAFT_191222 [Camillea tinctor]|nr:hypothetical protein F4810DRAFT_191222 [Camillea tinctor]
MDRDHQDRDRDGDLDGWRQARLGDEPIYCAAPIPSNPDDIICPGSDDELDHAAKVSKRLRYEEQGLRYLQGKPLRILSASLRGPFESSSGWQNPWLPGSSTKQPQPDSAPSQPAVYPVTRQPTYRDITRLTEEEDRTTPGADDSMICHLPSPQSNHNLDLLSGPLDSEKRNHIQSWAKGLPSTLEKDEFWAPDQCFDQQNHEHSRKRPAGKEWLKTKRSKRTRPNDTQGAAAVSTPTPMAMLQSSTGTISKPQGTTQSKQNVNQSFDLATPSSSVDRKQRDPFVPEESEGSEGSIGCPTPTLARIIPDGSQGGYSDVPMSGVAETLDLDIEVQHQDRELPNAEYTSGEVSEQRAASTVADSEPTPIGNTSFESRFDDSFHYRAHPPKGHRSPTIAPSVVDTDLALRPTPSKTLESPKHEEIISTSLPARSEEQNHREEPETEYQRDELPNASPHPSPALGPVDSRSEEQPNVAEGPPLEAQVGLTNPDSPAQTVVVEDMALPITTEHVTVNAGLNITSSGLAMSLPTLEHQVDQKACSEGGESPKMTEQLVDEGATFVEIKMDMSRSPADEGAKTLTVPRSPRRASVVIPKAESIASASNSEGLLAFSQTSEDKESDVANDSVVIPVSQLESGVTEVNNISPLQTATSCTTAFNTITNAPVVKAEHIDIEKKEPPQSTPERPAPSIEPQSPWVPEIPPVSDLEERYIKSEPIEDVPLSPLPRLTCDKPSSPRAVGCEIPNVPPSQQSPWAGDLAGQARMALQLQMDNSTREDFPRHPREASPQVETDTAMSPSQLSTMASHPALDLEPKAANGADSAPSTPVTPAIRSTTPEPCFSIKSFANFNTPSPQRRRTPRTALSQSASSSFTGQRRGILVGATPYNPWGSATRSSGLRVSFAPLPHEEDDGDDKPSPSCKAPRAASPPPQAAALDVDPAETDGRFQNHFDTMKRRADSDAPPRLRFAERILPSFSQATSSPGIGAMGSAFRDADARRLDYDVEKLGDGEKGEENLGAETGAETQAQGEPLDDVADVIGNLNEFLDSWDVDSALAAQARVIY